MEQLCPIGSGRIIKLFKMKILKNIAIMACAVFALTSCEKEEIQKPQEAEFEIKNKTNNLKTGGEEEDFIIIYGVTENASNASISGAEVVLFDGSTSVPIDTVYSDAQGEFQFNDQLSGVYYFTANANGYSPYSSANMSFPASNVATLVLQQ